MKKLAAILLLLAVAWPVAATDLDDLNTSLPADSYDVSTHAAYLRALHLAVRTFGMEEHDGAGMHMIPMGTKAEMLASTEVNGRLYFVTDPPARMHIYRSTCDCWSPVAVYDPDELDFYMYVSDYDPNGYTDRVEYAQGLYDGTNVTDSADVYDHLSYIDGTDNPHGLEADDVEFPVVSGDVNDLVTRAAGDGAALIPFPTGTKFVDDLVSTSSGDGAALIPFSAAASSLSGASSLDLLDIVDEGYDVTLLLDDLILDDGPWIDVRTEGATGDGTTDDTAAIQAAIDAMTSGGVVYFPEGTYHVEDSLIVEANDVWLVGAGIGRSIIHRDDDVGTTLGAVVFNENDGVTYTGCGMAHLTINSEAKATTAVGVTVGHATNGAQVHFAHVEIDGDDFLTYGLDLNFAVDSTFRDVEIRECAGGLWIDDGGTNLANRNLLFERLEVDDCTTEAADVGAISMQWGNEITFRDCHVHNNMGRAVGVNLTASTNTRVVNFYGCTFRDNHLGSLTADYQVRLYAAANFPYTRFNFDGCSFVDAVGVSADNEHLGVARAMQVSVTNCYFDDPGPEAVAYFVVGNIGAASRLYTDDYRREMWTLNATAYVSGAGAGYTVNGWGQAESLTHVLKSGTPSAIDGVVGDRVLTTGANVGKGDPGGWVCETSGSYDTLAGAACVTDSDTTFTMAVAAWTTHPVKIGERLDFAATTPWATTPPTVVDVQVSGTTATITMNTAATSSASDTFTKVDPVWEPIAEIPIYHTEDDPDPGDIPAGVDAAGDLLGAGIVTGTFAVTGAAEGDFVTGAIEWSACTADADEAVVTWWAGTGTVGYRIQNITAAIINLDGADFYVVVRKIGDTVP